MTEKREGLESVRLNEEAARRLLQRATELDASLATESSVAELREAASGAGISDEAFQRALEEVRAQPVGAARAAPRTGTFAPRRFLILSVIAMLIGATIVWMSMRVVPAEFVPAAEAPHTQVPVIPPPPPAGSRPP